ncbi:MAG TPA: DUF262 domain-containing protein [Polyangiaceae bacterium]|nr:DUF262 domain-containing protein [Polyangiaceae bacterium]
MGEARIYEHRDAQLHELLSRASSGDGATLLIPDLQRPFVWAPDKVTLLVDSLIRGWPFGTLLLWTLSGDQAQRIPHRQFWRVVDRTAVAAGTEHARKNLPASYSMVLDGQQRLQSLVLAFTGDQSGFKLFDRAWFEAIEDTRLRGRSTSHWTWGQLCLDLVMFQAELDGSADVRDIDYTKVLRWVACDAKDGISKTKRAGNYSYPLPFAKDHPGRFIRVSRLWELAELRPVADRVYRQRLESSFLPAEGVPKESIVSVAERLAELVSALGDVKTAPVGSLELRAFDAERFDTDVYGNAIVNIFTRLNTAGRTLTTQEITFAWIKTRWNPELTGGRQADECFVDLQKTLGARKIAVSIDELVQAVSVFWSILCNDGKVLGPKDLLRGETVSPMAQELVTRWDVIATNFERCAEILEDVELEYSNQFESLNAVIVLAAWRLTGAQWLATSELRHMQRDAFAKTLDEITLASAERWIAGSHWAGRWRAGRALEGYAKDLATDWGSLQAKVDDTAAITIFESRMNAWLSELVTDATSFVSNVRAERREDVRVYFLPLWIWHRLEARRAECSNLQLPKTRKVLQLDVDHIISVDYWKKNFLEEATSEESEDRIAAMNEIGNCFLLEKNFNISKSAQVLLDFIGQLHEIGSAKLSLKDWREALSIAEAHLNPAASKEDEVLAAVGARTEVVKEELRAFIRGDRAAVRALGLDVSGKWASQLDDKKEPTHVAIDLAQVGRKVTGRYGLDGELTATLVGTHLCGTWTEGDETGAFAFDFALDGTRFEGTWGMKKRSSGGGKWRGERQSS